jgi:single-strand DNA-binding protein
MKKGRPIFIEGRLRLDSWEDKQTGQKRSKLGVVLENFQFMGAGQGRGDEAAEAPRARVAPAAQSADAPPPEDDDVPF